jgi:hypothetical protein
MEKRWDERKLPGPQMIASLATAALLLATLALGMRVFARELGVIIGEAVVAVVRSVFSALGGFIAPGQR